MKISIEKILSLLLFLCLFLNSRSQEIDDDKKSIIEQRLDFLLDVNEGGDADLTTLFEQLEIYYDKPINLNQANHSKLNDLGLLNDIQINNLLNHIKENGKLISIEELQSIDGFDLETIRLIQPFTKVSSNVDQVRLSLPLIFKEGTSQLFLRYSRILEEQRGYSSISPEELSENRNARYLGSPDKLFSRYRFQYSNNLSFGITAEKDPGEEFFQGSQKDGFDFYSAHLFLNDIGKVKQLAIGDFQAQFGQGLTFWSGLAFGRSPSIFSLKRNAPKLRPYSSVQEDLFLRGGGTTLQHQNLELTVFYSSQKVDASVSGLDTLTNESIISSLSEDGFHRTPSELEDKNNILNTYYGGNLSYTKSNLSIGLTAVQNEIEAQFRPRIEARNQFSVIDNNNTNVGIDFNYLFKNINLFGEGSKSIDGGNAYTLGALMVVDPRLSIGVQYRDFDRDFKPIQSNAIGESSTNTNERGTFLGFEARITEAWNLSTYVDRFIFPWLRFQTDAPSNGYRFFSQLNFKPSKRLESYFRFRQRLRGENNRTETEAIDEVVDELLTNYRLHFSYQITKSIKLKSRIEYTTYTLGQNNPEQGLLVYQDFQFKKLSFPLSLTLRYAIFDTDSYESRIYAYENDVLYAFSIPAYNGRGSRFYILTKYHIKRGVDLWLRYAQTFFDDRNEIGSGRELIQDNTRSEIKAQLRIKF